MQKYFEKAKVRRFLWLAEIKKIVYSRKKKLVSTCWSRAENDRWLYEGLHPGTTNDAAVCTVCYQMTMHDNFQKCVVITHKMARHRCVIHTHQTWSTKLTIQSIKNWFYSIGHEVTLQDQTKSKIWDKYWNTIENRWACLDKNRICWPRKSRKSTRSVAGKWVHLKKRNH